MDDQTVIQEQGQEQVKETIDPALLPYLQQVDEQVRQAQMLAGNYVAYLFKRYGLDPQKDQIELDGTIKRG